VPIIECGPGAFTQLGRDHLAAFGPTVLIDIGFDMAIISQAGGMPGIGAAGPPQTGGAGSSQSPAPPGSSSVVPVPSQFTPTPPLVQNVPALIDTGATISCIDDALAQQLQLPLINQLHTTGAHGGGMLNVYLAFLAIPALNVTQAGAFLGAIMNTPGQSHRALLGRSLLRDMLFVYDGRSGSAKLSY
jgi:hypothetical protein